jgi:serine/threonine protein kinase
MKGLDVLVGKRIGRYRLEKLLGYGGMGAVYLSVHEQLARTVAIKVLRPSLLEGPPHLSFLDRFQDEARLVAMLHHPNILPVYDFGIEDGIAFLVMRYAADGSLDEQIHPATGNESLSLQKADHYLGQAATALDYAHSKGIVHRDVKPQNLLLEGPRLMLSDFGLARMSKDDDKVNPASAPTLSMGGVTIRGSPLYLAPEQGGGNPVDWRADIYALGITLYEMLTGHVPFQDTGGGPWSVVLKHILELPPPLVGQQVALTREIEAVVMKALAKEPRKRYQSAGEMALAFHRAVAEGGTPARPAKAGISLPLSAAKEEAGNSSEGAGRICAVCGTVNRPTAKFCMKDGVKLSPLSEADEVADEMGENEYILACPTCGFVNRLGARYCVQDGTLLYKKIP